MFDFVNGRKKNLAIAEIFREIESSTFLIFLSVVLHYKNITKIITTDKFLRRYFIFRFIINAMKTKNVFPHHRFGQWNVVTFCTFVALGLFNELIGIKFVFISFRYFDMVFDIRMCKSEMWFEISFTNHTFSTNVTFKAKTLFTSLNVVLKAPRRCKRTSALTFVFFWIFSFVNSFTVLISILFGKKNSITKVTFIAFFSMSVLQVSD